MKYLVACLFSVMLFRIAEAQDKIDSDNQQYVEGEGYVIYKGYAVPMNPPREGPSGDEELVPERYQNNDNSMDSYYNYTNKQLNPEYNRGAEEKKILKNNKTKA